MTTTRLDLNDQPGMAPAIRVGDTFSHALTFVDEDNANVSKQGVTVRAAIRDYPEATSTVASFAYSIGGASNHVVTISLSSNTTSGLTPGVRVWDYEEETNGVVTTRVYGEALVSWDITR